MPPVSEVQRSLGAFGRGSDPLAVIRVTEQEPIELHGHPFHELVFVIEGEGEHVTESEQYALAAGDAFLVNPGLVHGFRGTRNLHLVNIIYYPQRLPWPDLDVKALPGYKAFFQLEPALRRQHEFKGRLTFGPDGLRRVSRLVRSIEDELHGAQPGRVQMAVACFMQLKGVIARAYSRHTAPVARELLRISALLHYMEMEYGRAGITLDVLAEQASMARSTLNRVFNAAVGMPPVKYLISIRFKHAAKLLNETDMSVTDIAFQCGFRDSNFFSRQFKREHGVSPRVYRKA